MTVEGNELRRGIAKLPRGVPPEHNLYSGDHDRLQCCTALATSAG